MPNRKPTPQEQKLLALLVSRSTVPIPENWHEGLLVCPMDDGGMGSLRLFPKGKTMKDSKFGEEVSEFQFNDLDGIIVSAALNIDREGNLFELDIWKIDFGKLLSLPVL